MASVGKPNPVGGHVGMRVWLRRILLGLSQEKLGDAISLTFQQVQKYERGANWIGASELLDLSGVLEVLVAYFYDAMGDDIRDQSKDQHQARNREPVPYEADPDPLTLRESIQLIRFITRLPMRPRATACSASPAVWRKTIPARNDIRLSPGSGTPLTCRGLRFPRKRGGMALVQFHLS